MSAAIKIATLASGFTLFSAATFFTIQNPQQDFSKNALAIEHIGESSVRSLLKPKMYAPDPETVVVSDIFADILLNRPSSFMSYSIGGHEIKSHA